MTRLGTGRLPTKWKKCVMLMHMTSRRHLKEANQPPRASERSENKDYEKKKRHSENTGKKLDDERIIMKAG